MEGGPDREAPEVVLKYQFVYLNVGTVYLCQGLTTLSKEGGHV